MTTRRQFMGGAAAGALVMMSGCGKEASKPMRQIDKVGIQTYTLRDAFEVDAQGTLQMIKDAGYDYVELNGRNVQQMHPQELKNMLDRIGLPSPSSHISIDALRGNLDDLMITSRILGLEYLVVPYIAEDQRSLEDWKAHTKLMQRTGKILRDEGFKLAYHNHQFEFDDLGGGTTAMEIIMEESTPEVLDIQMDLFWSSLAGIDIGAWFKKYPGRYKLCHIKDMGPNKSEFMDADYGTITSDLMKNVGEGTINFEEIFAMNDVSGMEYFIAEHDQPKKPYGQSIETSLNAIRAMRF